ncbi:hypothetical protein DOTSEDRAFT_73769 [Dothistroma septosporum NZE10]|uniref:Uncharacterized protein n=1 Tax=Dothistroma septosporum (strain NZE10 / CBS 128990) TaxID=675120 RepID=N1PGF0_DOTSN|nr:hypothetical protein DOTSEDRAFT_73769 [Dothistroma septosporum NZE10]
MNPSLLRGPACYCAKLLDRGISATGIYACSSLHVLKSVSQSNAQSLSLVLGRCPTAQCPLILRPPVQYVYGRDFALRAKFLFFLTKVPP